MGIAGALLLAIPGYFLAWQQYDAAQQEFTKRIQAEEGRTKELAARQEAEKRARAAEELLQIAQQRLEEFRLAEYRMCMERAAANFPIPDLTQYREQTTAAPQPSTPRSTDPRAAGSRDALRAMAGIPEHLLNVKAAQAREAGAAKTAELRIKAEEGCQRLLARGR